MIALQDRDETLFYRTVVDHIEELMSVSYAHRRARLAEKYPRGVFLSIRDAGRIAPFYEIGPSKTFARLL
jgi:hypothetical protein